MELFQIIPQIGEPFFLENYSRKKGSPFPDYFVLNTLRIFCRSPAILVSSIAAF